MSRITLTLALLGLASLPALAGGWSSFENTFPAMPCQDGWAACLVNGSAAAGGAARDAAGRPLPADARFGWFDLAPTASLSPFVGLSAYSGPVGGAVAAVEPPPEAPPVANNNPPPETVASYTPPSTPTTTTPSTTTVSSPPPSDPTPTTTTTGGGMRPGSPSNPNNTVATNTTPTTTTTPATTTGGGMRPGSPSNPNTTPTTTTPTTAAPTTPTTNPMPVSSNPTTTPTTTAINTTSSDDSCDDLVKLEPAAMMGQLRTGQAKCLEARIGSEPQQTTKDKVSRLLITDANAKGNKVEWERLMKRHLEDIDRSDPDLCFNYALHLSRGGVGRAQGVIRWADYALENKAKWSGTTYKTRVFGLYKLRAEAANKLWQDADNEFQTKEHTDENEAKADRFRGTAKDYAREWLDYAKASGQDTKTALALCVSAAGNRAFCEGG